MRKKWFVIWKIELKFNTFTHVIFINPTLTLLMQ